jgi:hypothetical protein
MKRDAPDDLPSGRPIEEDYVPDVGSARTGKKRTQNKGMSIERWIFYEGLRVGNADMFADYAFLLPEKRKNVLLF